MLKKKYTKIENLNETVLQLTNLLSKQSGNISHLESGLSRKIASLQKLASILIKKVQEEKIEREKTIELVKKQLALEIKNHVRNVTKKLKLKMVDENVATTKNLSMGKTTIPLIP